MRVKSNSGVRDTEKNPAIIGTYEGEALDSNITNKNGLDITAEVIDYTLTTDDYKDGIEYGWFIGFLGHPEDPGCQEFKDGCIVMTDMKLNDNGKVWAKFNLINTPVGQIVKTYIDAGVRFGISIRGAGDIIDNSVDPESFVFRGFDLVAFPAYPESIPTFSEIAASTDVADQKKYKAICAAVKKNLPAITSAETIKVLKSQFAKQSDVYKALEAREQSLKKSAKKVTANQTFNIDKQRFDSVMHLYLETVQANHELAAEIEEIRRSKSSIQADSRKKLESIRRITASQIQSLESEIDDTREEMETKISDVRASMQKKITDAEMSLDSVRASCDKLKVTNSQLSQQVESLKNSNLIYKQRVNASADEIKSKDSIISDLRSRLRETVTASTDAQSRTSNLDAENARLRTEIEMCKKMLREYQDAYASMFAASLGVDPEGISVSDEMSVSEMRKTITSATNTMNIGVAPSYDFDNPDEDEDFMFYGDTGVDGMVTM